MVKPLYASKRWVPFAQDWGGNHLGIDLDPDVKGVAGQVINFGRDEEDKRAIAPSITAFVEWMLGELLRGNFSIERLNTTFVSQDGLQQFIRALYCEKCEIGFLPDEMASPLPQGWKITPEGWCPVNSDGSLGTPRERVG